MKQSKPPKPKIDFIEFPIKNFKDFTKTKTFYSNVFNWKYKDWGDDYSDTKDSGLGSGLNGDASHKPKYPLAVIYVEDLESSKEQIINSGGKITKEIFSFHGGRRFHFNDPSGNELAVWSDK
jgi:uncharacterized protein